MAATTKTFRSARSPGSLRAVPACVIAALLSQTLPMGLAWAQDDASSADTAAARALAVDGLKLAEAGRCGEAIDKLGRAEKLHHASIVQSRLGECLVSQGKIVDGTELLRKVLREPIPPAPSPALLKARERAQTTLDSAKGKIASLSISIQGPSENNATVTVDGQTVPTVLLDGERPTDPGEHVIEATAPGFLKSSAHARIGPGEKLPITLKLEVDPNAAAPTTVAQSPVAPAPAHSLPAAEVTDFGLSGKTSSSPDRSVAYVSVAIGGAALLVGAGFGVIALKDKADLDKHCFGNVCPAGSQEQLNSANTAATVSTVLVSVGAAGLALGTILFLSGGSSSTTGSSGASRLALARPRAWVGVGQAGFAADF